MTKFRVGGPVAYTGQWYIEPRILISYCYRIISPKVHEALDIERSQFAEVSII